LFWPQFALLLQITLLLASTIAAVLARLIDYDHLLKYFVAVDVGFLIYVCTKTWNLIDLIRRLTWHYEQYNRMYKEHQSESN
jgi:hypothetical protein